MKRKKESKKERLKTFWGGWGDDFKERTNTPMIEHVT